MNNTLKLCYNSLSFLANSASRKWTPILATVHSQWNSSVGSVRYKQHLPIHLKPTHPPISQVKIIEKHLGEEEGENSVAGKFPQTQQSVSNLNSNANSSKPQVQVETDSMNGKYEVKVNFTEAPLTDPKTLKVSLEPFRESSILHIEAEVESLDLRPHHHHDPPHHQRISHMFSRHFRLPENIDKSHLVAHFMPEEATLIVSAPLTKEIQDFKCHYVV